MGVPQEVKSTYLTLVQSGNIRYNCLPAADIAIADDAAWDQLWAAAAGPATAFWVVGFAYNFATTTVAAEHSMLIDFGWGGADGAAVAAANVIVANFPVCVYGVAAALGPMGPLCHYLPYPVRVPALSRMAARIAASPTGGVAFTSFRVIYATAVGT
jgi:hypothetical protein